MLTDELRKYQERIEQNPADLAAYEALERLHTRAQDFAALVELYRMKAPHLAEVGEKRLLWQKVARVAEEVLDDPDVAIVFARDTLPPDALDRGTLRALEGLCRRHKRWRDLEHFLALVGRHAEDRVEGVAATHRLGELYRHELAEPAKALETLGQLLREQPRHPEGQAALTELLSDAALRDGASAALEEAYRAVGDWDRLFKLYDRLLKEDLGADARASWLLRRAGLVEERRGPQAAFPEFAKAFLDGGRPDSVRERMEAIASRAGLWRDLLQVYLRSLEGSKGDATGNAILRRAAEIAEEHLGLKQVAEKCWRQLLDFDLGNEDALAALERIHIEAGDDAALLGILEMRIDLTLEPDVLRTLYARAGDLAEHKLNRVPAAIEKYEALLKVSEGDAVANAALLRLYPRAGRWQELVAHLLRNATDADRVDVRRRVAELYEDKLRDVPRAIEQWALVREAAPSDTRALEALTRLYERAGQHESLRGVLESRAALAKEPAARWALSLRVAGVLRKGLRRALDAADLYGAILGEAKTADAGEDARRELEAMLGVPETRARAAALLEAHYTEQRSWTRLVDLYDRLRVELPTAAERARVLEAVAYVYEHELASPERAFWSYGRALKEHPASPFAEGELLRIATELAFQDQLAGLLEDALDTLLGRAVPTPPPATSPAVVAFDDEKTNVVSEAELLDAAELVEEAEEVEPIFDADLVEGEDATGVAEVLADDALVEEEPAASAPAEEAEPLRLSLIVLPASARVSDEAEPREETALRFSLRLAALNEEVLDRPETAASWYREVRKLDAEHDVALVALDRLATARGDFAELREVLRARVDRAKKADVEVSLRLRLGALLDEQFSDPQGAIDEYRAALRVDPAERRAFDALESVLRREARPTELAELYRATLALAKDRAIQLKLAKLLEEGLDDPEGALVVLREVIAAHPKDEEALTAFERAADTAGYDTDARAEELLRVVESLRDLAQDPVRKRERERRAAALLESALGRAGEAVTRYAKVLREDGADEAARESLERLARQPDTLAAGTAVLEPYYRDREEWGALIRLLELRLSAAESDTARAALFAEVARINEDRLKDTAAGLEAYTSALKAEPASATYLDAVDRLACELGRFEELCEILDDTAVARELDGGAPAERVAVLRRLAEVAATALEDRERALRAYQDALALEPDNLVVFRALEEIYAHLERWRDLAGLFQSALERDPSNRAYALRLADLLEVILESPEEALTVLRGMLARGPKDTEALRAFEGVFTRAGFDATERASELIPVLETLRDLSPDPLAGRAYEFRIAGLLEHSLLQPEAATPRYGRVLTEDPKHEGALDALERLSLLPECRVAACALLELHYRKQKAHGPLADVLERRLADVTALASRADLLTEVGHLREDLLSEPALAFSAYARAFSAAPDRAKLLAAATRLGTELARHEELARLLEDADAALARRADTEVDHRAGLLVFLAALYRDTLNDAPRAISAYERAHALAPTRAEVFAALEALYTAEERFDDLAALYRAKMARDASDRTTGLKLAHLCEEILGASAEALDVLRGLLSLNPKDVDALRAFDNAFVAAKLDAGESASELLPILAALRDAHSGAEAREYEYRAGELLERALEQPAKAVPHYAAVLQAAHDHGPALAALERLMRQDAIRPAVADVLEPHYRAQASWRPLITLLELRAGDAKKPKERAKLLAEVGRIAETSCEDKAAAFDAYARAFEVRPEEEALLQAVSRLAMEEERQDTLADLLEAASVALAEDKRKVSVAYRVTVLQRLARTAAEVLGDNDRAIDAYTRALDLDPNDDATLTGLDRLFTAEGRARELAETLEREIARAAKVAGVYDRVELLRRLARLREEVFGDQAAAAESFEALRRIKADDAEATSSLERLYEATHRWRDLADLLLATTADERSGRARLLRAATLLEENVDEPARAREVYGRLHAADASDLEALRGLVRVLSRTELSGREAELLTVFESLEAHAETEEAKADLIHQQGALLAGALGQPEAAVVRFTRALELQPGHREALLALEGLARQDGVRDVAIPKLEVHYERVGAWQSLVELYEWLLPASTPDAARKLLGRTAGIYERELRNPRLAFRDYARLFRLAPQQRETLDVLERLAQEMGSFERLANLYDELVRELTDKALSLHLSLRLARLYDDTLGRRALAVDRYRFALELDPSCQEALDALDRISVSTEDWPQLQRILTRKLELATVDADKVVLYGRLGALYERELGFAGAAVDAFEAALSLAPEDEPSIAALERIFAQRDDLVLRHHIADTLRPRYEAAKESRRLAALDLGIAEVLPPVDRESFLLSAAQIHQALEEDDRAFRILIQGLHDGCATDNVLATLEKLAHATGAWNELCAATDAAAEVLREDDPRREALVLKSARWYWDQLQNPAAAEHRYTWIFLRDPAASPAFRALEAVYTASLAENPEKLLDLYRRRLAVVRAKDERAQLLRRMGYLCADFLGRNEDAVAAYEEALRLVPEDADSLESLVPLYEKTRRFNDLCRVLQRQLERAQELERFVLHRRLAEVYGAELNDDGDAIHHYRAALAIVPGDIELWRAVRWHCARARRWSDLADALRHELELTPEPEARVAVARELAQVHDEHLNHAGDAADALAIVLELEPADTAAAAKYEQLLRKVERWDGLAAFYDARLAASPALDERVRLLGELASVAEQHLADPTRAVAALAQRCELKPDDLSALRELARLYDQQGRWKECFEFLKAQVKRLGEIGEVATELLCRMGQLCEERANNIDVAEKCYKRALTIEPRSTLALDGLKRVYAHRKEPTLVAQVLEAQEALSSGEALAALATERGVLLRDQLQDVAAAGAAFEAALRASPLHAEAAVALLELAEKGGGQERVRKNLALLVEVFAKTRRIRERHLALHTLGSMAEAVGDGPHAIAAFEAAYQAASTHLPTLLALARLYYDSGHWEKALKMLQILLLNEGSLPTPADRVQLFHRLGSIRQKMGERARAINMYQRALEIDAAHAASRKALNELLAG